MRSLRSLVLAATLVLPAAAGPPCALAQGIVGEAGGLVPQITDNRASDYVRRDGDGLAMHYDATHPGWRHNRRFEHAWKPGAYLPAHADTHRLAAYRSFHLPAPPRGFSYYRADRPTTIAVVQNGTGRIVSLFSAPNA